MLTDSYETLIMKKEKFFLDMQKAQQVSMNIFEQSKKEILLRMKRQEVADLEDNISIKGYTAHSPSIIETQVMNAIPDPSLLNSVVFSDCTRSCAHEKSLHVYVDIKEGNEASITDVKTLIYSFVKKNHKETCAEFVFFSGKLQMYSNTSGKCLRFKLRDDFLSGKLNDYVLYHWQSYESDNDCDFEDMDERCVHCYGTLETKPLSAKSFDSFSEWYLETPLVCQIIFEKFINNH